MIRSIANKTLALDAEQCRVMVRLFLHDYFQAEEKLESVSCVIKLVLKSV